ncbi:MAG: zf-HC2 domain-containing protein [candidate division Zixibacteria bacterium]|nr:zf-HC2 domain-containing protein [candidate division Zixibacteria bacterium]
MDHGYFKDRISAFHDGALKNEEEFAIAQHLKECQECQQLLSDLRRLDRLVEQQSDLKDDAYWEQAARRIDRAIATPTSTKVTPVAERQWQGLWWKFASVAASVAVLAFIALYEGDIKREAGKPVMKMPVPVGTIDTSTAIDVPPSPVFDDGTDTTDGYISDHRTPEDHDVPREVAPLEVEKAKIEAPTPLPAPVKKSESGSIQPSAKAEEKDAEVYLGDADKVSLDQTGVVAERNLISAPKFTDTADAAREKQIVVKDKRSTSEVAQAELHALVSRQTAGDESIIDFGETAGPAIRGGRASEQTETTLEQWRQVRDSLSLFRDTDDLGSDQLSAMAEKETDEPPVLDEKGERMLIEAHYRIALMTDDKSEQQESIIYLEEYIEKDQSQFRKLAREYLNQLKTE